VHQRRHDLRLRLPRHRERLGRLASQALHTQPAIYN
jgi:hypothetical protein